MSNDDVKQFEQQLESIRVALLSLKASGQDGFEGLLRLALTNLTNIPFRLASSGLQGGLDGEAVMLSDGVCFEAKRYSEKINRETVITKIADLARDNTYTDRLWVLGATTEVSAQLATIVKQDGDRNAISTLILDWAIVPLPLLAVVIVDVGDKAIDFLIKYYDEKTNQKKVSCEDLKTAFKSVSAHHEFAELLQKLKSSFNVSCLSFTRAIEQNAMWREQTFGSVARVRDRLGQPLAVIKDSMFPKLRSELCKSISDELQSGNDVVLSGDEGNGKSWTAAQLCFETEGMALFISAERFDGVAVDRLENLLIDIIIKQSGDIESDALRHRWRHRLGAWKRSALRTSMLVVVDGINQRQNIRWDRLLNGLQNLLSEIGGGLVVTIRPQFLQKSVAPGLAFIPKVINIPEWLPLERDALLNHYGVCIDWLDEKTLHTLLNPRLLSVASATLPHQEINAWKGLTTDRLLMEHLRASQIENFENETFSVLTDRLSTHAEKVLEHVQASSSSLSQMFQADSNAVIETRFFRPLSGPGDLYELREAGLTLALGFTLVDQLWQTHREGLDLTERVVQLIEPINELDRTADVFFASLLVGALDQNRFSIAIFKVLLDTFANLQNIDDQRLEEFVEIVKCHPEIHFDILKSLCLESERRINVDWFIHAAFEIASNDTGWQVAEAAIHRWLRCYNKDPVEQTNRGHRPTEAEYEKYLDEKNDQIDNILSSLSNFEQRVLEQMVEVDGDLDELFTLALKLLAGRPLANFADTFVMMGMAFSLNEAVCSAEEEFVQLTTFNRLDRVLTRDAFLKAIEPLRTPDTSLGGAWTIVRMLYATDFEDDAAEASLHADELRKDWPPFKPSSTGRWRNAKVANPVATDPVDMQEGMQQFSALSPSKIWQTMQTGSGEHAYTQFLPVACRFDPEIAIGKTSDILDELLTRKGFPLRQLILIGDDHIPLVSGTLATNIIKRIAESDVIQTLPEQDRETCRRLVFTYAAPQLSAEQQLTCMKGQAIGSSLLISVIPSLVTQPTDSIIMALQDALSDNSETAAYGVLTAARFGNTQITAELEALILRCCSGSSSKLRAISYDLAVHRDLVTVRQAHVASAWSAKLIHDEAYEEWFGSVLMIKACVNNEILVDDLLRRISAKLWFTAERLLGAEFRKLVISCFNQQLQVAVNAVKELSPPLVDITFSCKNPVPFPIYSIDETSRGGDRFPKPKSWDEALRSHDDYDEKQERLHTLAEAFFNELTSLNALLLVQRVTIEDLQSLAHTEPSFLPEIANYIEQVGDSQFVWLRNHALVVGNLLSAESSIKAANIFRRAATSHTFITQDMGDDLTLEHQAIWSSKASKPIEDEWRRRLLTCHNDVFLAREVLAAERFGAIDFLRKIVNEFVSSQSSLDKAYAITIAGYSSRNAELVGIVEKHTNNKGISGDAVKHALESYEDNKWAHYWTDNMWNAPTPAEFWRCLMIAKTCMDARVNVHPKSENRWAHYAAVFRKVRKAAICERNKEREKRLVGREVPKTIYILNSN